jgi:hypothetical protein
MTEPIAHPTFLREVANLSFWIVGWVVALGIAVTGIALIVAVICTIIDKFRKGFFE